MRALAAGLLVCLSAAEVQQVDLSAPPRVSRQYVSYAGEPQVIAAGKHADLELRFQVHAGFHVNSHTPKSELLIPTKIDLAPAPAVKVEAVEYPAGKEYSFSFDPSETLDVYQDGFILRVPLTAAAGEHELNGVLTYQACDHAACYPPRKLPVDVLFTAR